MIETLSKRLGILATGRQLDIFEVPLSHSERESIAHATSFHSAGTGRCCAILPWSGSGTRPRVTPRPAGLGQDVGLVQG